MITPKVDNVYWTMLMVTCGYPVPRMAMDIVAVRVHSVSIVAAEHEEDCHTVCEVSLYVLGDGAKKKPMVNAYTAPREQTVIDGKKLPFIGVLLPVEAETRYSESTVPYKRFTLRADFLYETPDQAVAALCDRLADKLSYMRSNLIHNRYTNMEPDQVVTTYF
jgi:hypothetical protein